MRAIDLAVVGSGAAALTAAISARLNGLQPVVIEKSATVGGTTALSGGVIWIPANPLMQADGVDDSSEAALRYLQGLGLDDAADPCVAERRAAFVAQGPKIIEVLLALGLQLDRCATYPDYFQELPGAAIGRPLEPKPLDARRLGPWHDLLTQQSLINRRLKIRVSEFNSVALARRSPKHALRLARVLARSAQSTVLGRRLLVRGEALVGQLLLVCERLGIAVWTQCQMTRLHAADGRVTGLSVVCNGREDELHTMHGVVLAAGGYARNDDMRGRYARQPSSSLWTSANQGETGEVLLEAMRMGAATARMDEAWYSPSSILPSGAAALHNPDRTKPHAIIVDGTGQRFVNEAANYHHIGRAIYERNAEIPAIPSWLIIDSQHRQRYPFVTAPPSHTPRGWIDSGYMKTAASLRELARACDVDEEQLEKTVASFNRHAADGRDPEFGRGDTIYDHYMGDPTNQPNPTLGPITKPPFYAVALYPGDIGTCGGLVTNAKSQVLDENGVPIDGLCAAGNIALHIGAGKNWGAGATIGSAMVFGYIAGLECARGVPTRSDVTT